MLISGLVTGMRTRRIRWAMMAGAAASGLMLVPVGAASADAGTLPVLSHYYDPGTEIVPSTTITCQPGGEAIHGGATFGTQAGDQWQGTTSYDYCIYPLKDPGWYAYSGTETFTGTVTKCGRGTGTMTWRGAGTFETGTDNGGGLWYITPRSGTGALASAHGAGTSNQDVTATLEDYGYFAGSLGC